MNRRARTRRPKRPINRRCRLAMDMAPNMAMAAAATRNPARPVRHAENAYSRPTYQAMQQRDSERNAYQRRDERPRQQAAGYQRNDKAGGYQTAPRASYSRTQERTGFTRNEPVQRQYQQNTFTDNRYARSAQPRQYARDYQEGQRQYMREDRYQPNYAGQGEYGQGEYSKSQDYNVRPDEYQQRGLSAPRALRRARGRQNPPQRLLQLRVWHIQSRPCPRCCKTASAATAKACWR